MKIHEKFMKKCLDLALLGLNKTKTNPLVGCVIVHNDTIISNGYHEKYGGNHAEKNAIELLKKSHPSDYKKILKESTLYVNLEPCAHYGKTPPCVDLIIKHKIKEVVIGTLDPFAKVSGKSAKKLKKHTNVIVGIMKKECEKINQTYFINHKFNRPFIILKWAESQDGFINNDSKGITKISNNESIKLTHKWRSEIDAIMVGTNTVLCDNPKLTTRHFVGKNPIRITIDRTNKLSGQKLNIMNGDAKTIILHEKSSIKKKNIHYLDYRLSTNKAPISDEQKIRDIIRTLYSHGIRSILIEGGSIILNNIINQGLWDEARIFISTKKLDKGIKGPKINYIEKKYKSKKIGEDNLILISNNIEWSFQEDSLI